MTKLRDILSHEGMTVTLGGFVVDTAGPSGEDHDLWRASCHAVGVEFLVDPEEEVELSDDMVVCIGYDVDEPDSADDLDEIATLTVSYTRPATPEDFA